MPDLIDKYIKLRKIIASFEEKRRKMEQEIIDLYEFDGHAIYRGDSRVSSYTTEVWEYDEDTKRSLKNIRAENNKELRAVQLTAQLEGRATKEEVTRIKFEQGKYGANINKSKTKKASD